MGTLPTRYVAGPCLVALAVFWPVVSQANDSSIAFVGGVPHIQDESDVALVSENLRFRLFPSESMELPVGITCETYGQEAPVPSSDREDTRSWFCATRHYRASERLPEPEWYLSKGALLLAELTYTFQNRGGETRALTVGLPFRMPGADYFDRDVSGPTIEDDIEGFVTLLDGEAAAVRRVDLDETQMATQGDVRFNRLYLTDVVFEPGQERTLVHRYQSVQTHSSAGGGQGFTYLLRTGAGWAGPIGRVEIDFVLPGVGPCLLTSLPHTREGDSIRVAITEWEPDTDFEVFWETNEFLTSMSGFYADDPSGCDAMLSEDPARIRQWVATTELAHGAPHDSDRAAIAAEGAARFCQGADLFSMLRDAAEMGDEEAQAQLDTLTFVPSDEYPGNVPASLRACLERARTQLSR